MSEGKVVEFDRAVAPGVPAGAPEGAVLGWIVKADDEGIWVDHPEHRGGPILALSTITVTAEELATAIEARTDAVLLFLGGGGQPVLIGLRKRTPVVEGELVGVEASPVATVDGQKVRLEGRDEVVLRCGKASITLRRSGRVVIRGVQVESRASGRNRIKGGAVLIN